MSVSQIEQDLACTASQATAFEEVRLSCISKMEGLRLRLLVLLFIDNEVEWRLSRGSIF